MNSKLHFVGLYLIDFSQTSTHKVAIPDGRACIIVYTQDLINTVLENQTNRVFKFRSLTTEVSASITIVSGSDYDSPSQVIADRLLNIERAPKILPVLAVVTTQSLTNVGGTACRSNRSLKGSNTKPSSPIAMRPTTKPPRLFNPDYTISHALFIYRGQSVCSVTVPSCLPTHHFGAQSRKL